jgi:hypothetical protein
MITAAAVLINGAAHRPAPWAFPDACISTLQCCWRRFADCFEQRLAPAIVVSLSGDCADHSGMGHRLFDDCCTIPMTQSIASTPLDLKILRMRVA